MKCENCDEPHNGEFGSGRFCSKSCANSFASKQHREETNKKVSATLIAKNKLKISVIKKYDYVCSKCDNEFIVNQKIRKDRSVHCSKCKRKARHSIDINNSITLFDLSKRTISKILKRAKIKCAMCSWDKTSLDIHHIEHRKNNGSDNDNNLICLCPNCHRMAHENKYTIKELLERNVRNMFNNWREFYNPKINQHN
jgi:DNA-directed RNA polymerase subunit RPC12/RpoP